MSTIKFFFRACNVLSDPFTNWISSKNVCVERDIVYDSSNPDILKADLYYSKLENNTLYPILINVHGGGFVDGDKKFRRGFSCTMARHGFFVININYGLCPENKFPYFINNTIAAVNWAIDNNEKYKLDVNKIVICGDSSGSFIAAVSAASISNPEFSRQINTNPCKGTLKAALLFCGVYDFNSICDNKGLLRKSINYTQLIMGKTLEELAETGIFNLMRPENYINSDYPPTFITYSTKDQLCKGTSKIMIDSLKEKNIPYEVFEANNYEDIHCFHLRPIIKNARKCLRATFAFLKNTIPE